MTLPLNSRLSALYDTNGTQKDFSFGFRVFFDPDNGGYGLEVRRQTADGYEVIPKSDYLVLPVADNSAGVVRFSVAPSAGQQIYIAGKTPTIQQLVLTNFGRYSAESIETQFDFITAIIQEWLSALGEETRQRIAADDILTQYVVQRIDAFVQQVNQNWDDKSQEIEDYISTIMPSFTQTLRDEIEAFAVAGMQDAIDQTLAESKAEIDDAVARANAAALAAAITGKVYDTPEAGVDPVTGVQNGAYYNVRSPDDESYVDEYQNVAGIAVATGKNYPSGSYVETIAEYTALPLKQGKSYALYERVQLDNGDIVKTTINGNANNPNVDMTGWASEFYKAIGKTGYLYVSKLKGDGTDETNAFQQELNQVANLNAALGGGVNYKCNRKGTVLISHVVMPAVTGMIIDFTGTVFKVPDGTNVLDKDILRFNSIKKSYVFNLSMDGNSANLPDDTSGLGQWIGRCIMFRLGNSSADCIFFNTKVVNALYCASQWGNNISNITFQNIEFDNIGEHVFYISGNGGGLNKHIFFRGFDGGSWGTNPNAALNAHECAVIKSSQTIGFNDDFVIEDSEFNQTSLTPYATVIMNNNELLRCRIENIKVAGNITAIIYPSRTAHFCDIDGVYNLSGADNIRLVYSLPSNTEIKRYTARNIQLPAGNQVHMQVFDKLSDATLFDFSTSNPVTPMFRDGKSCVFEDVSFLNKLSILNIQHDIDFIRTKFLNNSVAAGQGLIESMGLTTWVDGKYVTFNECEFSNTSGYSWVTQNNNARVRIKGGRGIMRNPFNRAGTTMKYLDIDGVAMPYSGNPLANVSPVFSTLRGLIGYDGTQKRNFLKWTGQVTVSSGSNAGSINLSSAIARSISAQDVYVVAPNLPAGTSYTVGVDSNLVTITLNTNAASALQFLLKVDVSD